MVYDHWKKRQATYKEYKDVMRSCRKTITKVKAQLELHRASVEKDNRNVLTNKSITKRRRRRVSMLFLGADGNIVTKDEEKVEVSNAFFCLNP